MFTLSVMRGRPFLILAAVLVASGVIGVAIAGLPESPPDAGSQISLESTTSAPETTTTTRPAVQPPEDVTVLVVNGANAAGLAGSLSDSIEENGYEVLTPTNTAVTETTVVYHRDGFIDNARELAELVPVVDAEPELELFADPLPVEEAENADIVIVVGTDHDPAA